MSVTHGSRAPAKRARRRGKPSGPPSQRSARAHQHDTPERSAGECARARAEALSVGAAQRETPPPCPRPYGPARVAALCVVVVLLGPWGVAAQDGSERWLLLPVLAGAAGRDLQASEMTSPLESALRAADTDVMPNAAAGAWFETHHSSEPSGLSNDELARLSRSVMKAARHLALGELRDAQRAMESVQALSPPARDAYQRDNTRARQLFNNCVMAAYLYERERQHQAALRQMLECLRALPGLAPEGRAYPAEVGQLFEQASRELPAARLSVQTVGKSACKVRLNGMPVGETPLQSKPLRAGVTRLQVECGATPGRVHPVELSAGDNAFVLDPAFDAALQSRGALALRYDSEAERDGRALQDAQTIAQTLGLRRVALLWSVAGPLGTEVSVRALGAGDAARELDRARFTSGSSYPQQSQQAIVRALRALSEPPPRAAEASGGSAGSTSPSASAPALSSAPPAPPAPMPPRSQQHAAAGAILAVVGGAGIAVSWVMYALRQPERRALAEDSDRDAYRKLGVITLATGAVGNSLLSVSEFFWLPDDPGVPGMAWVASALGLGLGAAAFVLALTNSDCKLGDFRVGCQRFTADHFLAPLIGLHALPLITAPLWYLLRAAVRPANLQLSVNSNARGSPSVVLQGWF
jgi:hypothetical protein